jgi:hypothetical protein
MQRKRKGLLLLNSNQISYKLLKKNTPFFLQLVAAETREQSRASSVPRPNNSEKKKTRKQSIKRRKGKQLS